MNIAMGAAGWRARSLARIRVNPSSAAEWYSVGSDRGLIRTLIPFVAFIPFFAFRELGHLVGDRKLFDVFFRKASGPPPAG